MPAGFGSVTLVGALGLWCAASLGGDDAKAFINGKDLEGWEGLTEYWSVKDGAVVGSTAPKGLKFNTFLCSKTKYRDFEIQFDVRLTGDSSNSGLQIRSKLHDPKSFAVWGPQCDMAEGYWGSLFGEHFGPGGEHFMMKAAPKDVVAKAIPKKGEFVKYYIKCVGKHVTIKLNDLTTVDDDFKDLPEEGIIAFQLHSGPAMEVTFRNIAFTNLTKK
jgi:hypothetical protein